MERKLGIVRILWLVLAVSLIGGPLWSVRRAFQYEKATHTLAVAVDSNDTSAALAALRAGADPNTRQRSTDRPPTITQTLQRFWQQMRDGKARAESESYHRPPMIALAAKRNNMSIVKALLERGAKPDAHALFDDVTGGETALMLSVENYNSDMVQLLMSKGADPNFNDTFESEAPLLKATDPAIIEMLLAKGADVHVGMKHGSYYGITPLRYLIINMVLNETIDVQWHRRFDRCAEVLLAHGADINETKGGRTNPIADGYAATMLQYDSTPIQIAAERCEPEEVRFLLAKGADPNLRDRSGRDALRCAIDEGITDTIEVLLDYGVNPNRRDKDGRTPLFLAVEKGEDEPVRALIRGGANVNVRDKHGKTPLQLAIKVDNGTVEEILRAAGAER